MARQTRFDITLPSDIRFGHGRASEVPSALACLGATRVLVVTGRDLGRAARVRASLEERGIWTCTFPVPGEPDVDLARAGVAVALDERCDAVLGYGGGSAVDVAKAVAILAAHGTDPLDHLEVLGRGRPFERSPLPWVAVPTTAGTGSEVTCNAVLSAQGVRASLRSPLMLARAAIVDPDLLVGLPTATIVSGGLDALTQVIEPFLSARATPVTDALAREGIRRSARSLRRAVAPNRWGGTVLDDDPEIRADLALASLLGGMALANAGLGAVHGLASAIGGRFAAPHGAVCAALLAPALDVTFRAMVERAPTHPALARSAELAVLLTGADGGTRDALAWLDDLRRALAVPALAQHGVTPGDIPQVVADAARASSMKAHPIELTEGELAEILTRAG